MEERITVQLTKETLYDFLLYHTYSKLSGFLTNVLGLAVGIMGVILFVKGEIGAPHLAFYIFACAAFLVFNPLQLKSRAKKEMKYNKDFQAPWEYVFDDEGIHVSYNEKQEDYEWSRIRRVVTAPKTIGIYYGDDDAFMIPKGDFGDRFVPILTMIGQHIGMNNIRLR